VGTHLIDGDSTRVPVLEAVTRAVGDKGIVVLLVEVITPTREFEATT